jgi:hypothetical protein
VTKEEGKKKKIAHGLLSITILCCGILFFVVFKFCLLVYLKAISFNKCIHTLKQRKKKKEKISTDYLVT